MTKDEFIDGYCERSGMSLCAECLAEFRRCMGEGYATEERFP